MADITHDEILIVIKSLKIGTSAGYSETLPKT